MRGSDERSDELFSYVDLEDRIPANHSLRTRRIVLPNGRRGVRFGPSFPPCSNPSKHSSS
jgi:hypothetical protein